MILGEWLGWFFVGRERNTYLYDPVAAREYYWVVERFDTCESKFYRNTKSYGFIKKNIGSS